MTEPLFDMEPLSLFDLPEPTPAPEVEPEPAPPTAPATDPSVTFLHTADWQLGMTRRFLAGEAQHTFAASRDAAVVRIGEVAAETGAEFVVVCGDVFDDPRVSTRIIRRTLDALADYPVPVYLLPGNHDPYDATSVYLSAEFVSACPSNVHVLRSGGVVRVREGVTIVAAPWHSKHPTADLVAAQLAELGPSDDIRIVVGHGGLDTLSPNPDPSIVHGAGLDEALAAHLVDYVALGDRHSVTRVGDTGRIWYSGAPEVTAFDHVEADPGHVLAVTLTRGDESTVDVQRHRVGRWSFRTVRRDMTGADDVEGLRAELDALPDKPHTVVQLALVGTLTVAENVALEELLAEAADRFAAVKIWERHHDLTVVSGADDLSGLDLQGYAAQAAAELAERAAVDADAGEEDPDAAAARAALSLLYRLAGSIR